MTNLYPFLIYVFVTTFTPGPNNIMSMVNGMNNSYPKILRFLEGIFTGFFVVMLFCGMLNVALASLLPSSHYWLKILGAIYMVYLAIHIIRSKPIEKTEENHAMNSFWFGFSMQFLNIKVILYGVTVFSLFIVVTYNAPVMIILFAILLAAIGFVATSCWALGGNIFRDWAQKNYRIFNLIMGGLLIYTAIASLI